MQHRKVSYELNVLGCVLRSSKHTLTRVLFVHKHIHTKHTHTHTHTKHTHTHRSPSSIKRPRHNQAVGATSVQSLSPLPQKTPWIQRRPFQPSRSIHRLPATCSTHLIHRTHMPTVLSIHPTCNTRTTHTARPAYRVRGLRPWLSSAHYRHHFHHRSNREGCPDSHALIGRLHYSFPVFLPTQHHHTSKQ